MITRIGIGTAGAVRVDTDDEKLYKHFANGIGGRIEDNDTVALYPLKKGGSHFHEYAGDKHMVSVLLPDAERDKIAPFRVCEVEEVQFNTDGSVYFLLPEHRKLPKGHSGHTRQDTERTRHPLSNPQVYYTLGQLIGMVNVRAVEEGVTLCVDDSGKLYGRIG